MNDDLYFAFFQQSMLCLWSSVGIRDKCCNSLENQCLGILSHCVYVIMLGGTKVPDKLLGGWPHYVI